MDRLSIRRVAKVAVADVDRRRRDRYAFPAVGDAQDGDAGIYFSAPDWTRPSGGLKVIYDHVAALRSAGIPAVAVHQRPGFRYQWFDSDAAVAPVGDVRMGPLDVLVIPEVGLDLFIRSRSAAHHVILNQSGHLTFQSDARAVIDHVRNSSALLGSVVVSEHSKSYLRTAFPGLPVAVAHNVVDPRVFHRVAARPARTLGYSLRRGADDIEQVLNILRARGTLGGWEITELPPADQERYASRLRRTRVLLSAPYQEGFGLPAAEAMACGVYVVGYDGFGGRDYLLPEFASTAPTGDVLALARVLEEVLLRDLIDPWWIDRRVAMAAEFIGRQYSPAQASASAVAAYTELVRPIWR